MAEIAASASAIVDAPSPAERFALEPSPGAPLHDTVATTPIPTPPVRRFDLPPEMVMIETAPEKRRTEVAAVTEEGSGDNEPRRPRRATAVEAPAEPLVQIETRK
jgi:hypothetical protein